MMGISKGTRIVAKQVGDELWGMTKEELIEWISDDVDREIFESDFDQYGSATAVYNAGFLAGWRDRDEADVDG